MNRLPFILPTLAALLAAAGCGPRTHTDPGKTIHARAGKPFRISVVDKPGTGYEWLLVDSAAAAPLVLVRSGSSMSRANRERDGGAGRKSWTFRPTRAGAATVSLINVPPSSTTAVPDTTRFRVVIE